jgi:hypothetical protein
MDRRRAVQTTATGDGLSPRLPREDPFLLLELLLFDLAVSKPFLQDVGGFGD